MQYTLAKQRILTILDRYGSCSRRDICRHLIENDWNAGTSKSTINTHLRELTKEGLVSYTYYPGLLKAWYYHLTNKGEKFYKEKNKFPF